MKCFVNGSEPLKIGGVLHQPGSVVDIRGQDQRAFFGDRLIAASDPELIRALDSDNAHPQMVVQPFRFGRVDYAPGDVYWAAYRSMIKFLPADSVRPATGDEVLAWVRARQRPARKPKADAPAPKIEAPKRRPGRPRKVVAAA